MCGIDSIEAVAAAERECDDLGMDAIETGVSIAFAMEAFEKGILTPADTDGHRAHLRQHGSAAAPDSQDRHARGHRRHAGRRRQAGRRKNRQGLGGFCHAEQGHDLSGTFRPRAARVCPRATPPAPAAVRIMTAGQPASAPAWCPAIPLRARRLTRLK